MVQRFAPRKMLIEDAVEFFLLLFLLLAIGCFLSITAAVGDVDVWLFLLEEGREPLAEARPGVVASVIVCVAAAIASAASIAPIKYQQQADEHAAQVCHVRHSVASLREGREEFDDGIAHDEVFGLDGDWDGEDEQPFVGEGDAKGEQYAIDGSGCSDGVPSVQVFCHRNDDSAEADLFVGSESVVPVLAHLHEFLHESCSESAGQVVEEETLLPHRLLDDASEHPYGEHVEEEVLPACVHEHVCEELPWAEVAGQEEVEAEHLFEFYAVRSEGEAGEEAQHVDDEQVFRYGRYRVHVYNAKC